MINKVQFISSENHEKYIIFNFFKKRLKLKKDLTVLQAILSTKSTFVITIVDS